MKGFTLSLILCLLYIFYFRLTEVHAGKLNPRLNGVSEIKIRQFIPHPEYTEKYQYFDVAVVMLDKASSKGVDTR